MEQVQYHIRCKKDAVNKAVLLPGDIERADYIGTKFFRDSKKIVENREFHIYNGSYEKNLWQSAPPELDVCQLL